MTMAVISTNKRIDELFLEKFPFKCVKKESFVLTVWEFEFIVLPATIKGGSNIHIGNKTTSGKVKPSQNKD